jgi:hypothetical protein
MGAWTVQEHQGWAAAALEDCRPDARQLSTSFFEG